MKTNNIKIIELLEQKTKKELIAYILILNMQNVALKRELKKGQASFKRQDEETIKS